MADNRSQAYTDAGVNVPAANALVARIRKLAEDTHTRGVISDIGGFGGLFRLDTSRLHEPVLVASTDGVGTKLKVAFAANRHDTVGIDLVAMSANDILVQGASPLFFLDYFACGKLSADICTQVIGGVAQGCRMASCALLGGETAEMPGMYADGEYDLAGFCVGIVDNARMVDGSDITVGDAVIGISSSGLHSNGFSLARKIVADAGLNLADPFPGEPARSIADILLVPTTIYVESVRPLMRDIHLKGMAHITGGGFYDNIPRILPQSVTCAIDFGSWVMPPVFSWLKKLGELTWPEMLQVFNCGVGFVLIVAQDRAEETINRIKAFNLSAWQIGRITHRRKDDEGNPEEQVQVDFADGEG